MTRCVAYNPSSIAPFFAVRVFLRYLKSIPFYFIQSYCPHGIYDNTSTTVKVFNYLDLLALPSCSVTEDIPSTTVKWSRMSEWSATTRFQYQHKSLLIVTEIMTSRYSGIFWQQSPSTFLLVEPGQQKLRKIPWCFPLPFHFLLVPREKCRVSLSQCLPKNWHISAQEQQGIFSLFPWQGLVLDEYIKVRAP